MSINWSTKPAEITPQQAAELVEGPSGKGLVLDVREPDELKAAAVKSDKWVNVPMSKIQATSLAKALEEAGLSADYGKSEDKPLVMMCRGGHRSMTMCKLALDQGCSHVANLNGGIMNYKTCMTNVTSS
ncbi:hypothetical protein DIPPA_33543 [Diplonema papillatum]|nr:hypothetical protein DIPPA_33543 [Diplonema papillatum]